MLLRPVLFSIFPLLFLNPNPNLAVSTARDQFIFNGFAGTNLSLDGTAAVIMPDGLLMLTNATTEQKGHAFYPDPLELRKSPRGALQSFSTSFAFGIVGEYATMAAHGLALFVSQSKNLSAATQGEFLGLVNAETNGRARNRILAVEFDTFFNIDVHDMNNNHVGIDVNSVISQKAASAGYYDDATGEFHDLRLISGKPMQAWVDYDGYAMGLNVTMAPLGVSKPKKPLLSATVDLSRVVTDPAYVGFASSTGVVFSRHYVLGWSFGLNGPAPALTISKLPALPSVSSKPRSKTLEIVLPVASAALVLTVAATIFAVVIRRARFMELREDWEKEFGPHRFSYRDLFRATNGFSKKRLLGIGGFGRVYRGTLPTSKREVAVKRVSHESRQGMREFVAEVGSLGHLRHRNIVQLLGYCRRKGELLLVYDYMPNGSLDKYLFDQEKPTMGWAQRFQIIKGVASGLQFLHGDWKQVVVHRDVKASNVLLDGEMNGRLGDFGLARLYDHGTDPHTTHVVGTIGYLGPELGLTSKATPATDVFAFGAFLLEVTCGRRPVEQDEHDGQIMLVDLVMEHWRMGSITDMVDVRLGSHYDAEEANLVLKLGLLCSHPLPSARPGMQQVVQYLDATMPLPNLSPMYQGFGTSRLQQNQVHQMYNASCYIASPPSNGTMSSLSGGR